MVSPGRWGHSPLEAQLLAGLLGVGAVPAVTADREPLVGPAGVDSEQRPVPVKPDCGARKGRSVLSAEQLHQGALLSLPCTDAREGPATPGAQGALGTRLGRVGDLHAGTNSGHGQELDPRAVTCLITWPQEGGLRFGHSGHHRRAGIRELAGPEQLRFLCSSGAAATPLYGGSEEGQGQMPAKRGGRGSGGRGHTDGVREPTPPSSSIWQLCSDCTGSRWILNENLASF